MQKKNLEEQLKLEGSKLAPNKIEAIYEKLGLDFSSREVNIEVENKLKEEGKKFVKNNVEGVYSSLGITSNIQKDSQTENRVIDEKSEFVPNVMDDVYHSIHAKNPHNKFYLFIHNHTTIAIVSSLLIAGFISAIVIPNIINVNQENIVEPTNTDNNVTPNSITPSKENKISIDVKSASGSYSSSVRFVVDTNGLVNTNKIVTTDDQSAYVVDNIGNSVTPNSLVKYLINSDETVSSFTEKYLTSALNCGIIEKQNTSQTNSIKLFVETLSDGGQYYNAIKDSLNDTLLNFIKNNKVVATIEISESTDDEVLTEIEDSELASLIEEAYTVASRIFVYSDGTPLEDAYISDDLSVWVDTFKDYSVTQMEDIVEFLYYISDNISTDSEIDETLDFFKERIATPKKEVEYLNNYLPKVVAVRERIFNDLKVNGNDLKAKYPTYPELISYLDDEYYNLYYGEEVEDLLRYTPNDNPKTWKWWENGICHFDPFFDDDRHIDRHRPPKPLPELPEWFKHDLEAYDNPSSIVSNEENLYIVIHDQYLLELFREKSLVQIDMDFEDIFTRIKDGEFGHGHRDDGDYNHYHSEPSGWEDEFYDWWISLGYDW